jgi:hypothetical protein
MQLGESVSAKVRRDNRLRHIYNYEIFGFHVNNEYLYDKFVWPLNGLVTLIKNRMYWSYETGN